MQCVCPHFSFARKVERARKRAVLAKLVAEARPVLAARGEAGAQSLTYPTIFEPPSDGWRPDEMFHGR